MRHRIIHFEGMPGSGKSTLSQFVSHQLALSGVPVDWYYEEEAGHPVRVKMKDCASPESFLERHLQCWTEFADRLRTEPDRVAVFESAFIQSTVEQMRYAGLPEPRLDAYLRSVLDICRDLNPVLIRLIDDDLEGSLRRICEKRGEEWTSWFVGWNEAFPYARERSLVGFDGLIRTYSEFADLNNGLLDRCSIPTLCVNKTGGAWETYRANILKFLGIQYATPYTPSRATLERVTGTYRIVEGPPRHDVEHHHITLELDGLVIHNFWEPRTLLLPKSENSFYLEGACFEFDFHLEREDRIRITLGGKWEGFFHERILERHSA